MGSSPPKTVLVTGASRNIGARLVERFAATGQATVLVGRSLDRLEPVARGISDAGGQSLAVACDIARPADVERLADTVHERVGAVDVVINNAAVRVHRPFLELTEQEWATALDTVLGGAFRVTQAFIGPMVDRGWGRVVNMAGSTAQTGAAQRAASVAAKAGLIGLTKALALEFAAAGVTVNAVAPAVIATDRSASGSVGDSELAARQMQAMADRVPVGRPGTMDEVCAACEYLASEEAGYVTGQVLSVNGGLYL